MAIPLLSTSAGFGGHSIALPPFGPTELLLLYLVLGASVLALLYGVYLTLKVKAASPGSAGMQAVQSAIREGATAYLNKQFGTLVWFILALATGLYSLYFFSLHRSDPDRTFLSIGIAVAFLAGSLLSYAAGRVGMSVAIMANARVANAALSSFKRALEIAFWAGTVSGMFVVGFGLIGATVIFLVYREQAMLVLVGFGFGGSLAALFMRVGGGIYTKAADIGADLVGKVELGIPEDDPRNAAVIADNVGDNVGDCAGMAADVFESYEVTLVAAIILGAFATLDPGFVALYGGAEGASAFAVKLIIFAILVRAVGIVSSIIGTMSVRGKDDPNLDPMKPINTGFYTASLVSVIGFGIVAAVYLRPPANAPGAPAWWQFFLACSLGIVLALVIGRLTEYFTSTERPPVVEIADQAPMGPAPMLITGLSFGMESSVWAIVAIMLTIAGAMAIFAGNLALSFYGVALAGLGLLTTTGFILAMDTYGPITDNANGIFEMSGVLREKDEKGEKAQAHLFIARLDAVGNTTKALTKGFAIATAVIAAVSLFRSFVDSAGLSGHGDTGQTLVGIQVDVPEVFIGLMAGGAVIMLFAAFLIRAVGRAGSLLVEEVRRQFREIPGLMEGTAKPDYARCVSISTAAAQKELLGPGLLAVFSPVLVTFALGFVNPLAGAAALGGFLAGAIVVGQLMAVFMANTGGAWDNAKKKIEDGYLGGKGTDAHKAGVIGDTVGDPLKDTAGPALNPMIKVINLVAILVMPLAISPDLTTTTRAAVVIGCLVVLIAAVSFSRRPMKRATAK